MTARAAWQQMLVAYQAWFADRQDWRLDEARHWRAVFCDELDAYRFSRT